VKKSFLLVSILSMLAFAGTAIADDYNVEVSSITCTDKSFMLWGVFYNNSKKDIDQGWISFAFYDASGKLTASPVAYIVNIEAGSFTSFVTVVPPGSCNHTRYEWSLDTL